MSGNTNKGRKTMIEIGDYVLIIGYYDDNPYDYQAKGFVTSIKGDFVEVEIGNLSSLKVKTHIDNIKPLWY
jgi:hypothetical protein